jgi:NitT/TauT family transport system substrate-binding protein
MFSRIVMVAAVALTAVFGAVAPSQAEGTKVRIGMSVGINMLPTLVAMDQGYFKDAGIDFEQKPLTRGSVAIEALAAGSLEFAESAHAAFFAASSRGIPLVGVAVASRGFYGKMIGSNKNASLHNLKDFKGKRIGIQVGTGVHTVFLMLLDEAGLKESDFKIKNIRVNDMPAAMASSAGQFDAVMGWDPHMTRIVQGGYGKEVISARRFEKMAHITYPFILSTTQDIVKNKPDMVQKVVNVYAKAHKFIRENKDKALGVYMNYLKERGTKMDEKVVRVMVFEVDRFGGVAFTDADWQDIPRTVEFMHRIKRIKTVPDVNKIIDKSFGIKAEAALK